jgi:hypothetical protein
VSLAPTPVTAALAGMFSGLTWPFLWPFFGGTGASATLALVVATIVLVALPAHAFVLGFNRSRTVGPGALDVALLVRVGAWLAGAVITALVVAALRGQP